MNTFRYPVDTDQFQLIREQGKVYVDKTDLIYDLVNVRMYNYVFLARPRRFGKSLLCNTFKAYFQGQKELFEGLKIMELEKEWKTYPVFHMDFNGGNFTKADVLRERICHYLSAWEQEYGMTGKEQDLGLRFTLALQEAYRTDRPACRGANRYLRFECYSFKRLYHQ